MFPGGKGGTTERNEQQGTEAEEESILIIQRAYLLSILGSLAKPALNPSPSLVLLHMSHLSLSPRERSSLLEKHTARNPTNAQLQLLRLRALVETSSSRLSDAAHTIAEEIATAVSRSPSDMTPTDMEAVSFIWSEWFDASPVEKHHSILLLSLRQPCASLVHPALLTRYYTKQSGSSAPVALLNTIKQHYRPAPPFYAFVLDTLSPTDQSMAKVVYEHWTRTCTTQGQKVKAALAYAELLMRARKGREAYDAISRVRAEVAGQVEEGELERGWDRVCREAQEDEEEEGGEDSDVDVAM